MGYIHKFKNYHNFYIRTCDVFFLNPLRENIIVVFRCSVFANVVVDTPFIPAYRTLMKRQMDVQRR